MRYPESRCLAGIGWAIVLAGLVVIQGCSSKSDSDASAGKRVTIRFISQSGIGTASYHFWLAQAQEFMKEHPHIRIQFDWAGTAYMNKYRAQLAAGDPHDIIYSNEAFSFMFARQGVSLNLTRFLENGKNYEGDKRFKESFVPAIIARARVPDGKEGAGFYAVPYTQFIDGMFYNKALFEKLGIEPPETWQEFLGVCEKLKQNGVGPIAADGATSMYNAYWFYDLGMRIVGPGVVYDTARNKPDTSFKENPGFLDVARRIAVLREKEYMIKDFEGSQWPAAQMLFVQGKAGMMVMRTWLPSEMKPSAPSDFRYGFFAFPTVAAGKGDPTAVQLKYNGLIVSKLSKHPDEAMLFVKKLVSRRVQERMATQVGSPAVLPALPFPEHLADTKPVLESARTVVGFGLDLDRDGAEWQTKVLEPLNDQLLFGMISPEKFVDQLQKEHEAFWARKRRRAP